MVHWKLEELKSAASLSVSPVDSSWVPTFLSDRYLYSSIESYGALAAIHSHVQRMIEMLFQSSDFARFLVSTETVSR